MDVQFIRIIRYSPPCNAFLSVHTINMKSMLLLPHALTIVAMGYAAYMDQKEQAVSPGLSFGVLAAWLCCRIVHIGSICGTGIRIGEGVAALCVSALVFLIALPFAWCFRLGGADVLWITSLTLISGTDGILVTTAACSGFVVYLFLTGKNGEKSPLIPFLFAAEVTYLAMDLVFGTYPLKA